MILSKNDIGKKITFKVKYASWVPKKETRILKDITPEGYAVVRYTGTGAFLVRPDEILSIEEGRSDE